MKTRNIVLLVGALILYSMFGYSGQHRINHFPGLELVTADVENVVVVPVERLVYDLSEEDAVIATCSGILLIVGRAEAASWFATILGQKAVTDFLFDVLTDGLTSGNFSNEELEEAADSCIVVMRNSKASA